MGMPCVWCGGIYTGTRDWHSPPEEGYTSTSILWKSPSLVLDEKLKNLLMHDLIQMMECLYP